MELENSSAYRLVTKYSNEDRYHLVVDSDDWENEINPALLEWGSLLELGKLDLEGAFTVLKVMIETIYIMGYDRAKEELTDI